MMLAAMLLKYLQAALRHAHYEILQEDGSFTETFRTAAGMNALRNDCCVALQCFAGSAFLCSVGCVPCNAKERERTASGNRDFLSE
jgi:hypothetical protein